MIESRYLMKIDRLISIIMLLLEKERISAHELATMFEVTPRTIYRDIDSINMAGIPVHAIPGVGGGFEIMQQYKVEKSVFSTADLSAILMGLSNLSTMVRGDDLANALAKVKSFIPAEKAKDIELKSNQIYIDLNPWIDNRNIQTYLEILKTALQDNRLLSFEYADRYGNKTLRKAEPYQLVLKDRHWYWHGYCLTKKDYRIFKISRTSNLYMEKTTFTPRTYKKPELSWDDSLDKRQKKITLRIHNLLIDRMLDYCSIDDFSTDGDEYSLVDFPFIENDYYYSILLSFGKMCECINPSHIRKEIKRKAQEIADIYS